MPLCLIMSVESDLMVQVALEFGITLEGKSSLLSLVENKYKAYMIFHTLQYTILAIFF